MGCKDENGSQKIYYFDIDREEGGTLNITDERITSEEVATQRATSEFLKNGYSPQQVKIKTHLTDAKIWDAFKIYDMLYRVINISMRADKNGIYTVITGVRYE